MAAAEPGRWRRILCFALLLLLPFGEGGASPGALLAIHSLLLLPGILLLFARSGRGSPPALSPNLPTCLRVSAPLFLGVAILASLNSPYPYASFLRCWDLAMAFLALTLAGRTDWGEEKRKLLGDCVLASAALQAVMVLSGAAIGKLADWMARFGLLNPNHEAAYLALGIFLAVPRCLSRGERGKAARAAGGILCVLAFSLLASRGALAGLAVGGFLLLKARGRSLSRRVRLTTVLLLLTVMAVTALKVHSRFVLSEDPFRYERIRIWRADLECFAGSPLLGVGPGIYRHVAHRFNFPLEGPVRYGRTFRSPHSDYLGTLVEIGVAGMIAGLLVLAAALWAVTRRVREGCGFSSGLLGALAALAVQAGVEDLSQRPALLLTAAILVAAAVGNPIRRSATPPEQTAPPLRSAVLLPALLVAWAIAVLNPYLAFRCDMAMRRARALPEMERSFAAALRANPFQADTYRFPATAFLRAGPPAELTLELYARFRRDLDEGLRKDSTSADLEVTRARLEVRGFRTLFRDAASRDRALASYRAGIRKAPHDPRPRVELALFLRHLGRPTEALDQIQRAIAEEPGYLTARLQLAATLLERGDYHGARKAWMEAGALRASLTTYRPESPYAADITREPPGLWSYLEDSLGTF